METIELGEGGSGYSTFPSLHSRVLLFPQEWAGGGGVEGEGCRVRLDGESLE